MRARTAAAAGVLVALAVAALAISKRRAATEIAPAVESTVAIRIVRRDRSGLPDKKGTVRDRAHVRLLTEALGVDAHPGGPCPADYAAADFGLVLSGTNVYVRRNVYVFDLVGDAGRAPSVVSVTSAGCRVGPPADLTALRRELRSAGTLD